jgi:hypothetical protein
LKPAQAMQLVRRHAREHGLTVVDLPGRGKGSHRLYTLVDSSGTQVARFGLTDHSRELSWTVLRGIEEGLAPFFGEKWMDKR